VSFLDTIGAAFGQTVNSQITAAEAEAQTVAQAVAVWGAVVVVELGIVIFLLAKKHDE
jgi:uncharacterized membrane protein YeaQ/YmgE (transglycosylase-associated protein family)